MRRTSIELALRRCAGVFLACALVGCATSKDEVLPHGPHTMLDVWNHETGGGAEQGRSTRQLMDARQSLRRPLNVSDASDVQASPAVASAYTRDAANEIHRQFRRLPNPDLVMYVFPHLAGTERVPVPGYSTVFPLHSRIEYALPGEREEDY